MHHLTPAPAKPQDPNEARPKSPTPPSGKAFMCGCGLRCLLSTWPVLQRARNKASGSKIQRRVRIGMLSLQLQKSPAADFAESAEISPTNQRASRNVDELIRSAHSTANACFGVLAVGLCLV